MIQVIGVSYTDQMPMRPDDAEFGVTIDYVKGKSDPVQVFTAMTELLRGFEGIDTALVGAVAPSIQPITVIEDIEAASITTWLRNIVNQADDEAIKSLDVKKAVGVYLVKAKYAVIEYLDYQSPGAREVRRLGQLRSDLQTLAREVAQDSMLPPEINILALQGPMNEVQSAKRRLSNGETVTIRGVGQPDHNVEVSASEPVEATQVENPGEDLPGGNAEMILLIRKADLIGRSKWEFRHGKTAISANIEDVNWLARFHRGEEQLVPGAEMRAKVKLTYQRDAGGRITGVDHEIIEVLGVIPPSPQGHASLFPNE